MVAGRVTKIVAAGILVLSFGAAVAYAATAEEAIKGRQACMKAHGAMMGVMVPMIKGEKPYDAAAVQASVASNDAPCAGWADWWGEDTKPGGATETWAKDEIWSDKAGFEAAGAKFVEAITAVAKTTDEAGFKAAFPALGGSCQGCHEKFRRPKE